MRNFQNEQVNYDSSVRISGIENQLISTLTWERLTNNLPKDYDLRKLIPGLAGYETKITPAEVVIDSDLSLSDAFRNIPQDCPDFLIAAQELLRVFYFSDDHKLHVGQVLIHHALENEVRELFDQVILKYRIPIGSVIPIADKAFNWDDYQSMKKNNGSAFNFRQVINSDGTKNRLSLHAFGLALDLNPCKNPCYGEPVTNLPGFLGKDCADGYGRFIPANGNYDLAKPGTFHDRHPVVVFLEAHDWKWGGKWGVPKDLHHFQKIPALLTDEVAELCEQMRG
jgi:peptidoglycan L-alanyl-D-glutamate endopeptidase CwlK